MLTKTKNDLTKPLIVWSGIFTALFVLLLIISIVITQNSFLYYTVCSMLGGSETYLKSGDPSAYQYYTSDYGSKDEVLAAANGLNERICEEGNEEESEEEEDYAGNVDRGTKTGD